MSIFYHFTFTNVCLSQFFEQSGHHKAPTNGDVCLPQTEVGRLLSYIGCSKWEESKLWAEAREYATFPQC